MFRLLRTLFFCGVAFLAGMLSERSHQHDLCEERGGEWQRAGYCLGE